VSLESARNEIIGAQAVAEKDGKSGCRMNQAQADSEKKSMRSNSNQPSSETIASTDLPALDGSGSPEKAHCKDGFASAISISRRPNP
jgi:hypothetical protein